MKTRVYHRLAVTTTTRKPSPASHPSFPRVRCVWDGGFVEHYRPPFNDLNSLRQFVIEQVATLREDHMRPINPTPYKVRLPRAPAAP